MSGDDGVNDGVNDEKNDGVNTSHHRKTKKPFTQPAAGSSEHLCSSERLDRGGWGSSRVASSIYIYIYSPLKKLPTQGPLLPHQYQSQDCTYKNPSNLVYHKMSVYDFSFMIPFILYSLKELRLGLNCLMKLLPYGTQSITRNLGMYTYILNFLLCISNANSILT